MSRRRRHERGGAGVLGVFGRVRGAVSSPDWRGPAAPPTANPILLPMPQLPTRDEALALMHRHVQFVIEAMRTVAPELGLAGS